MVGLDRPEALRNPPVSAHLGLAVMLGWGLVAAWSFRALGPRRGTLTAVIVGNLVVPCLVFNVVDGSRLQFLQPTAIGLAVALGILVGDPRAVLRIRPGWLDLPMLAYVAYPLSGLVTNGPSAAWDVGDIMLHRGLGTLLPYAAARRYLGDAEGARQVCVAIVVATLAFVPVVVYEAVVGPRWYLGRLLYGSTPNEAMADRLGGWRPEGFFLNGLTLASWMALAAVIASWLWLARGWRPARGPSWWPALVLILVSVGCRGIYGYITLGLGLATVAFTRASRTRWAIALLLLAAPVYIGLRVSGAWDARVLTRMGGLTGRGSTVDFRLHAEDAIVARVLERHPIVGFGVQIWHFPNVHETMNYWPDGQWLITLWSGGLAGLALHLGALTLIPAGLALALPLPRLKAGRSLGDASVPILGLAVFAALCMLDGLHNNANFTPRGLVAGTLVGIAASRRRGGGTEAPRDAQRSARVAPSGAGPRPQRQPQPVLRVDPWPIPIVTATACVLYVFGHAPVAGHEAVKLIGGFGAALLFASAGAVGAWAATLVPLPRLSWFAVLFAVLGVSFNLALHPASRPAATADILQGLALCGLAVATWRRRVGARAWGDATLVVLPLLAHFLLRPVVPWFPGVQYLFADQAGAPSLFPVFPWLTMAAIGARAVGETPAISGGTTVLLASASALVWWSEPEPGAGWPSKFPMDLTYAMLSCAAVEAAFTLAHGVRRLGRVARGVVWLGQNWLIYFYFHFAVAFALARLGIGPAAAVWALLAVGSLGATWLLAKAAGPFSGAFRSPVAWLVPLALIVVAGAWPGLPTWAVAGLAGCAGLIFAAYHGTLAYLIVNLPTHGSTTTRAPTWRGTLLAVVGGLARIAVVAALLAVPELVGRIEGLGTTPPTRGHRHDPEARPASSPDVSKGRDAGGLPGDE